MAKAVKKKKAPKRKALKMKPRKAKPVVAKAAKRKTPKPKTVRYIPDGQHTVTPYLAFRGADQVIEFYKRAFGAIEIARMAGPGGRGVAHAELKIGDSFIYITDEMPGMSGQSAQTLGGCSCGLHLYVEDVDAAFQRALDAGCKVTMPLMDMFWGDRFGKLTDPYGQDWSLATHKEELSPQEMGRRAAEAMAQMNKPPEPPATTPVEPPPLP